MSSVRVLIVCSRLPDSEIFTDKTRVEDFDPHTWFSYYWKAFIERGHEVTTVKNQIPDQPFDISLSFCRDSGNTSVADINFWYLHDSHLRVNLQRSTEADYVLFRIYEDSEKNNFNKPSYYFPFACDPEWMKEKDVDYEFDFFFSGRTEKHVKNQRRAVLNFLEDNFECSFYSTDSRKYPTMNTRAYPSGCENYFEEMSKARLSINIKSDKDKRRGIRSPNMRTFESLANSKPVFSRKNCPVNDARLLGLDDKGVLFFHDGDDLLKKAKYLLKNEDKRLSLGKRASDFVSHHHTFDERVRLLEKLTDEKIPQEEWMEMLTG